MIEQILLTYGLPNETVAAIMMLYKNTKVPSLDGDKVYFDIVSGVLQRDTLTTYIFIIYLVYVFRKSIDNMKDNVFKQTKERSRRYPPTNNYAKRQQRWQSASAKTPVQAETLQHSLERAAANKTEYMCFNQIGDISTQNGSSLKLVDKFNYLWSSVSSTKKDVNTWLAKAWATSIGYRSYISQTWPIK